MFGLFDLVGNVGGIVRLAAGKGHPVAHLGGHIVTFGELLVRVCRVVGAIAATAVV